MNQNYLPCISERKTETLKVKVSFHQNKKRKVGKKFSKKRCGPENRFFKN